jgi:hypothetical protein
MLTLHTSPASGEAEMLRAPESSRRRRRAIDLDHVADELNDRPRKRLGFYKPTEQLAKLLLQWPLGSTDPR